MVHNSTNRYIDELPRLVKAYNDTEHSNLPGNITPSSIPMD